MVLLQDICPASQSDVSELSVDPVKVALRINRSPDQTLLLLDCIHNIPMAGAQYDVEVAPSAV
jgi:hypothetical protein